MRKLIVLITVLVSLVVPSLAEAHIYHVSKACGAQAFGLPCEGTLQNNEAIWFATGIYNQQHRWRSAGATVTHRINSSAACVLLGLQFSRELADFVLVDIDPGFVSGGYVYKATGHYGNDPC